MLRVLLADYDDGFREELARLLLKEFDVQECTEGRRALREVLANPPDILVVNLTLPGLEGLSLLPCLLDKANLPVLLVTALDFTGEQLELAEKAGAAYCLLRSCPPAEAAWQVLQLSRWFHPRSEDDLRRNIRRLLSGLGLDLCQSGWNYWQQALAYALTQGDLPPIAQVYDAVATQNHLTCSRVERSMHEALCSARKRKTGDLWRKLFPESLPRLTNGRFLATVLQELRWEQLEKPYRWF